ncbi:aspartate aminotransferase family protein [Komagataeibacter nataicola]|uniref:Aspartate aminotransferase family protein n=1 Tax=Komagataeibacter nataicola TaxID=265960 RepID=A0A9N7H275_9PROT|nr:aminotransferase class III-fold pyridoxal phosphate-dependent enzyme [Komagataeibacter nataicola]AQU88919.1 aspartate aminotransferase family protein [Komagataeibacter nataicola]PYD65737.1 aspartate aminotransferase family protein [Komagataeibacter nataicola]WEQ55947.1 aminotransferase class III-fold pyridoxal phosphate-dependent enzyme [Komagataeibacter nataicola]WNM07378.1 aminotransferase class III-fold pyridoxal phosphate-dependent enzyme [Komagataeibacter nataicola]GBR13449.1 adenosylm
MTPEKLISIDRDHLIHPVSSWRDQEEAGPRILHSGHGAWLKDINGKELLDGFSGLWCVNVGYGCKSVVEAATEQMARLPYATGYFGFASEPAITLAGRLAARAPGNLNRIFFSQGGSDAVDSALRFIRFYQHARGTPERRHVIGLARGYHGSTYTGAGLTALAAFHRDADVPLSWQHHIPSPYAYRHPGDNSDAAVTAASVAALKAKVAELGADKVAAFFCEPVQGSGGVIVPPAGWMKAMRETCRELGILFVADEVITGFGRTGPLFACERENVVPDMMTVAKGLTSGYAPMGAVFMSEDIYTTIRDNTPPGVAVGHGMTYSAHPVSAAIGLAVLDLYEQGLLANGVKAGEHLAHRLHALGNHALVGDVRISGMLAGIELVTDKMTKHKPDAKLKIASKLSSIGYEKGVLFRAFGDDIIGLAPPLCCTIEEVDLLCDRLTDVLDTVRDDAEVRAALKG